MKRISEGTQSESEGGERGELQEWMVKTQLSTPLLELKVNVQYEREVRKRGRVQIQVRSNTLLSQHVWLLHSTPQ